MPEYNRAVMNDSDYEDLKVRVGEQAARSFERAADARERMREGRPKPLDPVSLVADNLLGNVFTLGHLAGEAAKAVGSAAERAASWIGTELQNVTQHDKPLDTPKTAPAAQSKDTPARDK